MRLKLIKHSRLIGDQPFVRKPAEPRRKASGNPPFTAEAEHGDFQELLALLSTRFIQLKASKVESEIKDALRRLVEFMGVGRSSLWQFVEDGEVIVLGSYSVPGAPEFPLGRMRVFDWYQNEIRSGRAVCFVNPEELPVSCTTERRYAESTGMKSHVAIPIEVGGVEIYGIGVATFDHERTFDAEAISQLRSVGEVLASAVARANAERETRRMLSELSHVTRVATVGQLAASIAHEINQPLCAIVSNSQAADRMLYSDEPGDRSEVHAALQDIANDGKRAHEVMSRARNLLRRQDLDFKPLSVNQIVKDVVALVHSDAILRHVQLQHESIGHLPHVMADKVQIQQVILNLIVNGMDALAEKLHGPRQVTIRTETVGRRVRVSVIDTGVGLNSEIASHMFEPFFTTKQHGLGMGLAINRNIVEAHGGKLWAVSNSYDGATVAFELPIVMEEK